MIRFIFIFFFLFFFNLQNLFAVEKCKGNYDQYNWTDCWGKHTVQSDRGKKSSYEGQWKGGKPHGSGTFIFEDGSRYSGQIENGSFNGSGTIKFTDGAIYSGKWKNNFREGFGTFTFPDKTRYEGEWKNNVMDGRGILLFTNGEKYQGDFIDGRYNGFGVYYYKNGHRFFGKFKKGKEINGLYVSKKYAEFFQNYQQSSNRLSKSVHTVLPNLKKTFEELSLGQRKELQKILAIDGLYNSQIDGKWGRNTLNAIAEFAVLKAGTIELNDTSNINSIILKIAKMNNEASVEKKRPSNIGLRDKTTDILGYSLFVEKDKTGLLFISRHKDGTRTGTMISLGGYKWFKKTFDAKNQPRIFLQPEEISVSGDLGSFTVEKYEIGNFNHFFDENEYGDQFVVFESNEIVQRIYGYVSKNKGFSIAGVTNESWFAGIYYPVTKVDDLVDLSIANPDTFCSLLSLPITSDTMNRELKITSLVEYWRNQGLICNELGNIVALKKDNKTPSRRSQSNNLETLIPASSGSGFSVSRDGYIITNEHVIEFCDDLSIIRRNKNYPAKVEAVDKFNDLALIKVQDLNLAPLSLSKTNPRLLDNIFAAGFPFGNELSSSIKATKGIVSSLAGVGNDYATFQIDAALQPGNSGGPVLNQDGAVVGVAVAKLDTAKMIESFGTIPENTNFAIKVSTLRNFLEVQNVDFLEAKGNRTSNRELAKIIETSTVLISCMMSKQRIKELKGKKVLFSDID